MLMKMLRDSYREITEGLAYSDPIATVTVRQPAANASQFADNSSKKRPQRRRSRLNTGMTTNLRGWSVRSW